MIRNSLPFYDEAALVHRLSTRLRKRPQEVIFLVGSPLSAPVKKGAPGVPDVDGMIDLIEGEFSDDEDQLAQLRETLEKAKEKRYQSAFQFLQGRGGQQTANEIVRNAVLMSRKANATFTFGSLGTQSSVEDACRLLDFDAKGWELSPATEAIGKLSTFYPERFGRSILTTNFDPLLEVSIRLAGGNYFRTTLHSDGNLSQTEGNGCHVIHFHGYWYGSDTLHTTRQLGQPRPRLHASLATLLREKLVLVCGYGGWDDAFTEALMDVVRDDNAFPEVLWTFFGAEADVSDQLAERLEPGINRGRVNLYGGIDCNKLFPALYQMWDQLEPVRGLLSPAISNSVRVSEDFQQAVERVASLESAEIEEQDRPPVVEICVGRDEELRKIEQTEARVIFLTGAGGQGKSTLAAKYFSEGQVKHLYSAQFWRDCKEESERFETQVASVVARLSGGTIAARDLANHSVVALVDLLMRFIGQHKILFVFDNVDHYVNLVMKKMVGATDVFVESLLQSQTRCRVVFTCRPPVAYHHPQTLSIQVQALSLESAIQLFQQRGAPAEMGEIGRAHKLTEGHALWLDLLAVQVIRRPIRLDALLKEIEGKGGSVDERTLSSIWATLGGREQLVLRAMAETVKPETETQIADYLRSEMNYARVIRTLGFLRSWNLIVLKRQQDAPDVLELHPLVRAFIRRRVTQRERTSVIDAIAKVYKRFIGAHKAALGERPSLAVLEYWTQSAELDLAAGKHSGAFMTLAEVADAFLGSSYPRQFVRAARLALTAVDWQREHVKLKGFETVFRTQIRNLSYLGEFAEVDQLLNQYQATVTEHDARYIHFCDLRAHTEWVRGDFQEAIRWGLIGKELKTSTDIDTKYEVDHTLALAYRDAGEPELALPTFLNGRTVAEVTATEELDDQLSAPFYGNIGRCLHFMGQIEGALICYQKSALVLERDPYGEHVLNQGFIRAWIGELLIGRQQFKLAFVFFRAAFLKWEQVSPPRADGVRRKLDQIKEHLTMLPSIPDRDVEKTCRDWIFGRITDL